MSRRAGPSCAAPGGGAPAEPGLLDRARAQWRAGEWPALAALAEAPELDHDADRAPLAALAAAGLAQMGAMEEARRLATQALDRGCPKELLARLLIGGVHNSLGRIAALRQDEPAAARLFEQAVSLAEQRGNVRALARARQSTETARLGLMPAALRVAEGSLEALRREGMRPERERILASQIRMLTHEIAIMQGRGQLDGTAAAAGSERRAASQLGQDLWVLEQTGHKRGGFFVEFGATDGVMLSNTLLLERDYAWTGICAEPNPAYLAQLRRNRRCIVSGDCILGETGRRVEFILADEFGGVVDFSESDMHGDLRRAYRAEGHVMELTSISLHDFLRKYNAPRRIDYLSIDTEGSEYDILSGFPFGEWDIRLITVEHNYTPERQKIRTLLGEHGYRATERDWDDWYVRVE